MMSLPPSSPRRLRVRQHDPQPFQTPIPLQVRYHNQSFQSLFPPSHADQRTASLPIPSFSFFPVPDEGTTSCLRKLRFSGSLSSSNYPSAPSRLVPIVPPRPRIARRLFQVSETLFPVPRIDHRSQCSFVVIQSSRRLLSDTWPSTPGSPYLLASPPPPRSLFKCFPHPRMPPNEARPERCTSSYDRFHRASSALLILPPPNRVLPELLSRAARRHFFL